SVLVVHQIDHVAVRLDDRANQLDVLLGERLLSAAQDLPQARAVYFDDPWRVAHTADRSNVVHRPPRRGRLGLQLLLWEHGDGDSPTITWATDHADGPTGRQSGIVPVRVGLPAASRTRS